MTNVQTPSTTVPPRTESASKNWEAQLKDSKGTVSIKRSKKSAPYAIQQNN
jgi:hypothetical protein